MNEYQCIFCGEKMDSGTRQITSLLVNVPFPIPKFVFANPINYFYNNRILLSTFKKRRPLIGNIHTTQN